MCVTIQIVRGSVRLLNSGLLIAGDDAHAIMIGDQQQLRVGGCDKHIEWAISVGRQHAMLLTGTEFSFTP